MDQDFDSPWKDVLEAYFREFMAFFFPWIEKGIAWDKRYQFLDKEFQSIVKDAEIGRRYLDKLVRVWRKNGLETWVLIHVEIQASEEAAFAERMYVYNYRTYDRYRRAVVSLAVLADDHPSWRPDRFAYDLWGCEVSLSFPSCKILDYTNKEAELVESDNPFALVVLSHLKALETRSDPEARRRWKLDLVKRLYRRGYSRQDVIRLFSFMDWVMHLPEELSRRFWDDLTAYEENQKMPYVTSVEKIGIKKGIQQGMQQGMLLDAQEMLTELLEERFGGIDANLRERIKSIESRETLKKLFRQGLRAKSLDEFQDTLTRTVSR